MGLNDPELAKKRASLVARVVWAVAIIFAVTLAVLWFYVGGYWRESLPTGVVAWSAIVGIPGASVIFFSILSYLFNTTFKQIIEGVPIQQEVTEKFKSLVRLTYRSYAIFAAALILLAVYIFIITPTRFFAEKEKAHEGAIVKLQTNLADAIAKAEESNSKWAEASRRALPPILPNQSTNTPFFVTIGTELTPWPRHRRSPNTNDPGPPQFYSDGTNVFLDCTVSLANRTLSIRSNQLASVYFPNNRFQQNEDPGAWEITDQSGNVFFQYITHPDRRLYGRFWSTSGIYVADMSTNYFSRHGTNIFEARFTTGIVATRIFKYPSFKYQGRRED